MAAKENDRSKKLKKTKIIKQLAKHGNKTLACEFAGISKRSLYYWCSKDPVFLKNADLAMSAFYAKGAK